MNTKRRNSQRRRGKPSNAGNPVASNALSLPNWSRPLSVPITPSSREFGKQYIEHRFISSGITASLAGNAVAPQLGAFAYNLNSVTNASLLASLYDQFRIDVIEARFVLRNNPSGAVSLPKLYVFPDFDDGTAPASTAAVLGHPRVQIHQFTPSQPEYTIAFSPRAAMAAYNGGVFTGFGQLEKPIFIDANQPNTAHYGLKYAIEAFTDTNQSLDVFAKVWLTMRNPL